MTTPPSRSFETLVGPDVTFNTYHKCTGCNGYFECYAEIRAQNIIGTDHTYNRAARIICKCQELGRMMLRVDGTAICSDCFHEPDDADMTESSGSDDEE
jgi:hypothetical protein